MAAPSDLLLIVDILAEDYCPEVDISDVIRVARTTFSEFRGPASAVTAVAGPSLTKSATSSRRRIRVQLL